jgi:hypothetical protein
MTLTSVTLDPTTFDDEWTEGEGLSSVDDWLRTMWGLRPGVSSPRRSTGPVHPSCAATAGWLQAIWGFGA